jgi:hypothetical protein
MLPYTVKLVTTSIDLKNVVEGLGDLAEVQPAVSRRKGDIRCF